MNITPMSIRAIAHSTVILLGFVLNVAWAQGFEEGLAAYNRGGDYQEGLAAYNRGDYQTAYEVMRPLAEGGNADAQLGIGVMYSSGRGVSENHTKAARWYRAAAEQGLAQAQFNLGIMYFRGEGIPQDFSKAAYWYRAAAKQGKALAQRNLGVMYLRGDGIIQDNITSHMWFNIASANGDQKAREGRSLVADRMSRDAIAESQSRARTCMETRYQDCK